MIQHAPTTESSPLQERCATSQADQEPTPLVVDLDHTFLRITTLHELFALVLFNNPAVALRALFHLRSGKAAFKRSLCQGGVLDIETLPVREDLHAFLAEEQARGRSIHLATAAERAIADAVAERHPIFASVHCAEDGQTLGGQANAERLRERFPQGFSYVGNHRDDLPVWREARTALVVGGDPSLEDELRREGIVIEQIFPEHRNRTRAWIRAFRLHQWAKNAVVLVPVALGWHAATWAGIVSSILAMLLLCALASLTYCVNDIADLSADRKHWSKKNRPFASGALPVRDGLIAVGIGVPLLILAGLLLSPRVGACLLAYLMITLSYSFGLKRIPLLDTLIIGILFTIRILLGIAASGLVPSAWLLTFSMFFFFSLAVAKRHTEILRAGQQTSGPIAGRGYHVEDQEVTLVFGIVASMASVLIVVIYLVDEVFSRALYTQPQWLWIAPMAIFLFIGRVWLLSHRGLMTDDPVAFAVRDKVSLGLGALVGAALILAI